MDPEPINLSSSESFNIFRTTEKVDPLAANLFMLNGEKWKKLRCKLFPNLVSGKMKMMFQALFDCGQELEKYLEEPATSVIHKIPR
jgi:hypothetical protein